MLRFAPITLSGLRTAWLLNRSDSFGFVNSAIVDCPFVFLALIIDLDETPIPLNLIVIMVRVALDRSNKHGVDANDGRHDADVQSPKIFWGHPEKRTLFINRVPYR